MFSLSWFTSIPGILITVGVLLLVAALVIFIVTSRKNKKKDVGDVAPNGVVLDSNNINTNNAVPPQMSTVPGVTVAPVPNMAVQPMDGSGQSPYSIDSTSAIAMPANNGMPVADNMSVPPVAPVDNLNPNIYQPELTTPVTPIEVQQPYAQPMPVEQGVMPTPSVPSAMPDVVSTPAPEVPTNNIEASAEPINVMPSPLPVVQPVDAVVQSDIPVSPVNDSAPVDAVAINVNEGVANVATADVNTPAIPEVPTITPQVVDSYAPVATASVSSVPSVEQVVPEMQDVNVANSSPVSVQPEVTQIYGGASPIVPEVQPTENVQPQIYGGANPLENTQSVSISQIASGINGGNSQDVAAINPVPTAVPNVVDAVATPVAEPSQPVVQETVNVIPNVVETPVSTNVQNSAPPVDHAVAYQSVATTPQAVPVNQGVQ